MGSVTPINKLLTPKLLLTVTPVSRNVSPNRTRLARKKLDFSKSPQDKCSPYLQQKSANLTVPSVNIINTINTPLKRKILNEGSSAATKTVSLGKGTFGTVIKCIYKAEEVAVKVIKNMGDIKEKNVLNLSHENIIKVIDIVSDEKKNYSMIIMDYYPNSFQLQTILENGKLFDLKTLVRYTTHLVRGLEYLHQNSILHLDVKPSNILVVEENVCKLCDFGSSYKIGSSFEGCVGTPAYTAPEIFSGAMPTEKCDIYSLGITMWQMEHSENPYNDIECSEVLIYKVVKTDLRPNVSLDVNADYSSLYISCWSAYPCNRPNLLNILYELEEIEKAA